MGKTNRWSNEISTKLSKSKTYKKVTKMKKDYETKTIDRKEDEI